MHFAQLLHVLLPLTAILSATTGVLATPALEKRISEASLQARWDALFKQAGRNGVQTLCQAMLPHATTITTSINVSETPITATEISYTTEVATDYTTRTYVEEASYSADPPSLRITDSSLAQTTITETILETSTTTLAPARRDLSESIKKLFKLLFADANAWTVAKCRTLTNPLTDTITTSSITFTPSIAATVTTVSTILTTTTEIVPTTETSVTTTQVTSTSLVTASPTLAPFIPGTCPDLIPVERLRVARFSNTELRMVDLPDGQLVLGSEAECIQACYNRDSALGRCVVYFWQPSLSSCFLKSQSWRRTDLVIDSESATDPGSVTGFLRETCRYFRASVPDAVYRRCCDNPSPA